LEYLTEYYWTVEANYCRNVVQRFASNNSRINENEQIFITTPSFEDIMWIPRIDAIQRQKG